VEEIKSFGSKRGMKSGSKQGDVELLEDPFNLRELIEKY